MAFLFWSGGFFFMFLIGPLLTSFIAVSAVFYEYQSHTMGNMLTTPYSRLKIILGKLGYISLLIIGLYACVALVNIICAFVLGFSINTSEIVNYTGYLMLASVITLVILPFAMFLTLLFRSFIPAMVISVAGIIPNLTVYHWDKCYLSPWAAPEVIVLKVAGYLGNINLIYPVISILFYLGVFLSVLLIYFHFSDQY